MNETEMKEVTYGLKTLYKLRWGLVVFQVLDDKHDEVIII
jgi:hypothetical protein